MTEKRRTDNRLTFTKEPFVERWMGNWSAHTALSQALLANMAIRLLAAVVNVYECQGYRLVAMKRDGSYMELPGIDVILGDILVHVEDES